MTRSSFVLALALLVPVLHCGSSDIDTVPPIGISCSGGTDSCSCTLVENPPGTTSACVKDSHGVCCADPGWPNGGECECNESFQDFACNEGESVMTCTP
jgi:hypothetical protein